VSSIGVLREGPLHAAVKAMLAAPGDRLEVLVDRLVIDLIRADGELVEVQTGGFGPLGAKLDALLDRHRFRGTEKAFRFPRTSWTFGTVRSWSSDMRACRR
jgi:hypothetical protein